MKRLLTLGLFLGLLAVLIAPERGRSADETTKEALQALQEFIGDWKGTGGPDKPKLAPKDPFWTETISWAWRFKGDDVALGMNVKKGKEIKSGEVRYLPAKKVYEMTLVDKDDKKLVFTGTIKNDALVLEHTDPETKDVQQIKMNSAADGDRFIYRSGRKKAGGTFFAKEFKVEATREGVSLGGKESKNICVVSGGKGTMQVSYKGETFYVCCSGCADAFRENPEKYVKEFKAKKK
jgi:YHS domain-containing protein